MKLPAQSAPVLRGPVVYRVAHGVAPSSVCSICESVIETVVANAGCSWIGLLEFEAECNAALDLETEGLGAVVCAAAGAALKYACAYSISNPAQYVADKACALIPGC